MQKGTSDLVVISLVKSSFLALNCLDSLDPFIDQTDYNGFEMNDTMVLYQRHKKVQYEPIVLYSNSKNCI